MWFAAIGRDNEKGKKKKGALLLAKLPPTTLTTVNVSVCGRTALSAAVLQVQTFCCSWWQTLIMCSTKQELGLHGRVAV